jgi:hypothetical protein
MGRGNEIYITFMPTLENAMKNERIGILTIG